MNYYSYSIEGETQQNIWPGVYILLIHPVDFFRQSNFTDSQVRSESQLQLQTKLSYNTVGVESVELSVQV